MAGAQDTLPNAAPGQSVSLKAKELEQQQRQEGRRPHVPTAPTSPEAGHGAVVGEKPLPDPDRAESSSPLSETKGHPALLSVPQLTTPASYSRPSDTPAPSSDPSNRVLTKAPAPHRTYTPHVYRRRPVTVSALGADAARDPTTLEEKLSLPDQRPSEAGRQRGGVSPSRPPVKEPSTDMLSSAFWPPDDQTMSSCHWEPFSL